jgi:hypothetical protein
MPAQYAGIFKIGDRSAGRLDYVQVNDTSGKSAMMPTCIYIIRGIEPDPEALPWREDWLRQGSKNSN